VKKIRGPVDTSVKLNVLRGTEQLEFVIVRSEIKIPSVEHEVLDGGVCNIRISRFSDDTDSIVKEAAKVCKEKSATSVLLDLRNNPGGYLEQAIRVSSHWVDQGKNIVTEKRSGKVIKEHPATIGQEFKGMKTVVLINSGSASASEIVAGALKDYNVATLVGEKSYGKGSVQEVDSLGGGTSLKITIARWFTPNDKNIDKEGIEPNEKVEIIV
jgi:carboxyl-terminal processing protease